MSGFDDEALLAGIEAGADDAKSAFCERFGPRVRKFAWHRRVPIDDIEDLVQDTLIAALTQIQAGKFERRSSLGTWVQAIFERRVQDLWRRHSRRDRRLVPIDEASADRSLERMDHIFQSLPHQETALSVREALAALPFRERLVLLLSLQGGYPAREIAQLLSLKPKTTESIMTSAKRRFRSLMTGSQENPSLKRLKSEDVT